jgi:GWxTD domain-containing protein
MRGSSLLASVFLAAFSQAGGLATGSGGDIGFSIDTAVFRLGYSDTLALEVYESIPLDNLSSDDRGMAVFETDAIVLSAEGDTLAVQQWVSEVEWIEGRVIVNGTILPVLAGENVLHVAITDLSNGRRGEASRGLSITVPSVLSEIEIANTILPSLEGSVNPLRKGGWIVFPAADGRFDLPAESRVYVYVELYGQGGTTVERRSRFLSATREVLSARSWDRLDIPEGGDFVGLLDSLDLISARGSGLHYLEVSVIADGDTTTVEKPLMIARETYAATGAETVGADSVLFLDEFRIILTGDELALFDALPDAAARGGYYAGYWGTRPGMRADFEQRCVESRRFATNFREGWQTDRGRVYIRYGAPGDVESEPLQVDAMPYEKWIYYSQGTEVFIFADRDGTGNYVQIYSTVVGETSYPNWEQMLQPIRTPASGEEFREWMQ